MVIIIVRDYIKCNATSNSLTYLYYRQESNDKEEDHLDVVSLSQTAHASIMSDSIFPLSIRAPILRKGRRALRVLNNACTTGCGRTAIDMHVT